MAAAVPLASPQPIAAARTTADRAWFEALSQVWHRDTDASSMLRRKFEHPAYRAILAKGPAMVPFILRETATSPGHWSEALRTLTGEDPVPARASTTVACRAWVAWGRSQGYLAGT